MTKPEIAILRDCVRWSRKLGDARYADYFLALHEKEWRRIPLELPEQVELWYVWRELARTWYGIDRWRACPSPDAVVPAPALVETPTTNPDTEDRPRGVRRRCRHILENTHDGHRRHRRGSVAEFAA